MTIKGTPTTLLEAIQDCVDNSIYGERDALRIKSHVRDFLAQHFSKPMLEALTQEESDRFKALFERIVK